MLLVRDKEKTEKFIDIMNLTWIAGKKVPPHLDLYFFDAETQNMLSEVFVRTGDSLKKIKTIPCKYIIICLIRVSPEVTSKKSSSVRHFDTLAINVM